MPNPQERQTSPKKEYAKGKSGWEGNKLITSRNTTKPHWRKEENNPERIGGEQENPRGKETEEKYAGERTQQSTKDKAKLKHRKRQTD